MSDSKISLETIDFFFQRHKKKCPKCSFENKKDNIFCVNCGELLDKNAEVIIKKNYPAYLGIRHKEKIEKMTEKDYEALMNRPNISTEYYHALLARPNIARKEFEVIKKKANMTIWQRIKEEHWLIVLISSILFLMSFNILAIDMVFFVGDSMGLAKGWSLVASFIPVSVAFYLYWKAID